MRFDQIFNRIPRGTHIEVITKSGSSFKGRIVERGQDYLILDGKVETIIVNGNVVEIEAVAIRKRRSYGED